LGHRPPFEEYGAAPRLQDPRERAQERRLAGAIGTNQRHDLAADDDAYPASSAWLWSFVSLTPAAG
jgi:hypothetical protein